MIKKHIPNFVTCLNLFSGCIGVYFAFQNNYSGVLISVLIAAIFDFLDGLMARLLHAYSPMGKELDSLADVVSFGFIPGVLAYSLIKQGEMPQWMAFSGFLITIFSALRLAKFNIDDRQSDSFLGLPVPANAIFWAGICFSYPNFLIENSWTILILIVIFSTLLVSEVPMFSLKFKNLKWKENSLRFIFLAICLMIIIFFNLNSLNWIILVYILISIGQKFATRKS